MSFPRYPKYKDSGVEWLGAVPEGWKLLPLRWFISCCSGESTLYKPFDTDDNSATVPVIGGNGAMGKTDKSNVSGVVLAVGRVGALCGNVHIVEAPAWITDNALVVEIDADIFCTSYLAELLRTRNLNDIASTTAQPLITGTQIRSQRVTAPPLSEQRAIAAFLDRETSKIDALVAEQRKLIELLKEKRQAVISHAVTKGLNPDVATKDSGIAWVRYLPEHWETPPVYARYYAVLGKMLDEAKSTGMHPIRYLRNADVNWDYINIDSLPKLDIEPHEYDRFTLLSGDILICEGGAGIGQTAIWQGQIERCAFQKALHRLRPWNPQRENPKFFYYCMRCVVETGVVLAGGTATIPHLTGEQLRKYRFPRPPKEEQNEIVEFLDEKVTRFAELEATSHRAIDLLQERRTALISAAVTGKIDVRKFVEREMVA